MHALKLQDIFSLIDVMLMLNLLASEARLLMMHPESLTPTGTTDM